MTLRERLIKVIDHKGKTPKTMEELTGIDRAKWANIKRKDPIRATEEHIEAVCNLWPEYALWITTGKTIQEAGQISPDIEEVRKNLGTGT